MCFANLYPGLFFHLTIGRMGLSSLCNFTVRFMLMYHYLLFIFITLLHLFVLRIFCCCIFVMSCDNSVKLFLIMKSSILLLYSSLCSATRVLPLSASVIISWSWFILYFKLLIVFHSRCSHFDRIVWCFVYLQAFGCY
jgi:hypothetical protein